MDQKHFKDRDPGSPASPQSRSGGRGGAAGTGARRARKRTRRPAASPLDAAQHRIMAGLHQVADRIELAAHQIDELLDHGLEDAGGQLGRVTEVGRKVSERLGSVAGYLRESDVDSLRGDLERQLRDRPVQTLIAGVAAGWLVGKILR